MVQDREEGPKQQDDTVAKHVVMATGGNAFLQGGPTKQQRRPIIVVGNTPWGKRMGNEHTAARIAEGILWSFPHPEVVFAMLVPPGSETEATLTDKMDILLRVPIGKPAVLLLGRHKHEMG